ncbi:MAG: TRAP transporter substrate-binding protein, partial [Pseudomonadota bacterium]|nr:TRAP transporter substrate-binding protein [Pseudomonadota bacterium]
MIKTIKQCALSAGLVAAVASTAVDAAEKVKPLLLKVPVAFSTELPALGTPIKRVAESVKQVSNNSVRMKIYEPGKLVAPFEILDAVSSGKVNTGYSTSGYWAGKIPAAPLFSAVPFGPEAGEFMAWLYYGNGMKLYQEMYDNAGYNVKVLPCSIIAPETSGWFSKPIEKPEDLEGLRMRFFGLGGKVMERLGVSTSLLPGGEIFSALEKRALDATEFSQPAIDQRLGLHKVVKYNYFPGWHQQATVFELLVNKDVWNKMHASQQAVLETTCKGSMAESLAEGESMQFEVMKRNAENHGVKLMVWNDDMLSLFRSTWESVATEESAKDPFFKKVY